MRTKLHQGRRRGAAVPRADVLAGVAPEQTPSRTARNVLRNRAAVLDGVVRDAAHGIDVARLADGLGRTRRQAQRAVAAAIGMRNVGFQLRIDDQGAEQQPGSESLVDEAAVLADPSDSGFLRPGLLHHGAGVDFRVDGRAMIAQP